MFPYYYLIDIYIISRMSILITQKDVKHLFGDKSWYINKKLERVYPKTSLFRISDRRTEIYDGRVPAIDRRDRQTDGRTPDRYITLSARRGQSNKTAL